MGITVAKASDLLSSGARTTTTRRSTGTKSASTTSAHKSSSGKEGNTFDALVKGHGTQDDNEDNGHVTHEAGATGARAKDHSQSRGNTETSHQGSQTQGNTTTQTTASSSNGDSSSPNVTPTTANDTNTVGQQSSNAASTVADMSQQVQTLQAWVAMAQAQTMPTQGHEQKGASSPAATDADNDTDETSDTPTAGTETDTALSSNAVSTLMAAMLPASALQSTPSGAPSPSLSQTGSSTATVSVGDALIASSTDVGTETDGTSASTSAAATGIALALSSNTVMSALMATLPSAALTPQSSPSGQPVPSVSQTGSSITTVPDGQATQVSSSSGDNAPATTGMDTLLAAVGQVASGHVTASGHSDTAALVPTPATDITPSAQSATQTDDTASTQQPSPQNATVSNVVVATSSRADSRDSLAALSTATDYTASPAYNAVTGATGEVAGTVAGTGTQNGLSDHSDNTGQEMDERPQNTEAQIPADIRLSTTGLGAPTSFTVEHDGNATDTQSVQMNSGTGDGEESGIRFLSSPAVSQSSDGTTSVSMTIMTADSTPVHVRLEGANGITTGVILESADDATSHHLANNRHELVTALGASGIDVGNLKIDVVTAADNNGNLNDQGTDSGTAYDGSGSGGMSGNGSGQNGGQSFAGNAWGSSFVQSGQIGADMNNDGANGSLRSTMMNAESGVNITA